MTCIAKKPASRPILRYHGGKWLLAPWIIGHFPDHRTYVEPFGGAASVLIRKPRSYAEIYNDLDQDVVNLFQILRGQDAYKLQEMLALTPFSRDEFSLAYKETADPIERARRLLIRSFMGFGSDGHNGARTTGFRTNSARSGTTPAHDWRNYPSALASIIDRLSGVVIENRDALQVMARHDSHATLHYVDPPYVHSTRSKAKNSTMKSYRHELTDDDHIKLLGFLRDLRGYVLLSGYDNPIYNHALSDWRRVERQTMADGARPRTEVLWINPRAAQALRSNFLTIMAMEQIRGAG